jgi:hypothetical protein
MTPDISHKGRRILVLSTVATALVLLVSGLAIFEEGASNTCYSGSVIPLAAVGFPISTQPVALNTVAYAEQVIKDKVLVPDVSSLGCGFRVIGVQIHQRPTNEKLNGITYASWMLSFYATNQPFVNGSTLNTDLLPHAILVTESSEPSSVNSSASAIDFPGPSTSCVISLKVNVTSSSCTSRVDTSWNLVQIRNTYLDVAPAVPSALFEINGIDRAIAIAPGTSDIMNPRTSPIMSYDQLLAIAGSMIP